MSRNVYKLMEQKPVERLTRYWAFGVHHEVFHQFIGMFARRQK